MKTFKRPNADPKAVPTWRHILVGYAGRMLGKRNTNRTYFRADPKVKGKAAVKRAKRERRRLREAKARIEAKASAA